MNATGNPSRDTVLDNILYYIDHNFPQQYQAGRNQLLSSATAPILGKSSIKPWGEALTPMWITEESITQGSC